MVTTSAPGSSGGINLADISRDFGGGGNGSGGGMAGVAVTRVASSIGGAEGPDRPLAAGVSAGRTDEEIQIVFDRYKAALYRLYNRELRRDPTLRGQIVLRLTIEPDGSVSMCELHSSSMEAPELAGQVVERDRELTLGTPLDPYFKRGLWWRFTDYFDRLLLPNWQARQPESEREQLIGRIGLPALRGYLETSSKIGVISNADEIILTPQDIDFLGSTFGSLATIFPRGGHLGNLQHRDYVARMLSFFGAVAGGS